MATTPFSRTNWSLVPSKTTILNIDPQNDFLHCSYTEGMPRKSFLHAFRQEGKTKYKPILGKAKDIFV